jgi:hypothetical protein
MPAARGSWMPLSLLLLLGPALPARAEAIDLTEEQFKTYHDYLEALQDPRVEKFKPAEKLAKIAHNFHVTLAELKQAIAKGERYGDLQAIAAASEQAIRDSLAGTPVDGRVVQVQVDTREGHAVAYVGWREGKPEALHQEACWVAARMRKAAPLAADLRLWAVDPKEPDRRVFDAIITGGAASKIKEHRIADFASTLYIKLFEQLHGGGAGASPDAGLDGGDAGPASIHESPAAD